MAKFLRVIFNLLLICYIAAALALFIPPLVGVTTAVTLEDTVGNQEIGSVNYAWRTPLKSVQAGDDILVKADGAVNVYTVQSADTETSLVTVADAEGTQIPVRTYVYKLVLTVPYLGYIAIALQTMEGMVILGAIAGILLVLCIITAIWARKRKIKRMKEDEEDLADENDNRFFENLASQKREADARAEADFAAKRELMQNELAASVAEPALDEEYEDFPNIENPDNLENLEIEEKKETEDTVDESEIPDQTEEKEATDDSLLDELVIPAEPDTGTIVKEESSDKEASEKAPEMVEAQTAEPDKKPEEKLELATEEMAVERAVETGNIPGVQAALEAALNTQQIQRHVRRPEVVREPENDPEPLSAEEIELAMPVYTAEEYLQKAYAKGQDPLVKKDELTGVTYIDFSECI